MGPFNVVGVDHSRLPWAHVSISLKVFQEEYGPMQGPRQRPTIPIVGLGEGLARHLSRQLWAHSMLSVVTIMGPHGHIVKDASRTVGPCEGHRQTPTIPMMGLCKGLARHLSSQLWAYAKALLGTSPDSYGPIQCHR